MSRRTLEEAFKAGYLAGFASTGEGYNCEWPYNDKGIHPESDEPWAKDRDDAWQEFKSSKLGD